MQTLNCKFLIYRNINRVNVYSNAYDNPFMHLFFKHSKTKIVVEISSLLAPIIESIVGYKVWHEIKRKLICIYCFIKAWDVYWSQQQIQTVVPRLHFIVILL